MKGFSFAMIVGIMAPILFCACKKNEILKVSKISVTDPLAFNELDDFDSSRFLHHRYFSGNWITHTDKDRKKGIAQQDSTGEYGIDLWDKFSYSDLDVKVYWKILGGTKDQLAGIILRAKDEKNFVAVTANGKGDFLRIIECQEGKWKTHDKARITPPDARFWHNTRVVWIGNKIQAYLDTKLLLETELEGYPHGYCGLVTRNDSRIAFDDIFITGTRK